ncbi:MAG: hypothetical protein NC548_37045 [Lachnospiraceae bacterium]|nr:hypothetical protein [Lachnospiraceae bacterium]MCM1234644.1 hypothetical protein [Ruminococcus flavefaciens]
MIIIGYQGIGKSSLAKGGNGFIDLESGNFWVNGDRDEHWAQVYANMAVHLSQQGYNVFTSSHKIVREFLKNHPAVCDSREKAPELLAVCYPALSLREPWTQKLKDRYNQTGLLKDFKAWKNAEGMYLENIMDLSSEELPVIHIVLQSMDYKLEEELAKVSVFKKGAGSIATQ